MNKIVTVNNDRNNILRQKAEEVSHDDIKSKKIKDTIKKMKSAIKERDNAVAIAAPQIGESVRIFLMSERAFLLANGDNIEDSKKEGRFDLVFINPEIIKLSKEKDFVEEGCLSVPNKVGVVKRSKKVKIKSLDEKGNIFERGASGLIAEIFQHEIDHLEGILFTDIAKNVKSVD